MKRRYPPVTSALIIINILYFAIMMLTDSQLSYATLVDFGAKVNFRIIDGKLWHFVLPMFMHGSFSHLIFNSIAIFIFAPLVEKWYGSSKFILIYLASGILSSIGSFAYSNSISVGASGAIYGLMAFHIYLYILKRDVYKQTFGNEIFILLAMNIAYTLLSPHIDIAGHFVGFFGGLAIYFLTNPEIKGKFPSKLIGIVVIIGIISVGTIKWFQFRNSEPYFQEKLFYQYQKNDYEGLDETYEKYIEYFPNRK